MARDGGMEGTFVLVQDLKATIAQDRAFILLQFSYLSGKRRSRWQGMSIEWLVFFFANSTMNFANLLAVTNIQSNGIGTV
jgi:hypothetical protein